MAREPLSQGELRAISETDDILAIEILVEAVTRRLEIRQKLGPIVPLHLDAELVEALRGLERLDGNIAERLAREVLRQVPPECSTGLLRPNGARAPGRYHRNPGGAIPFLRRLRPMGEDPRGSGADHRRSPLDRFSGFILVFEAVVTAA